MMHRIFTSWFIFSNVLVSVCRAFLANRLGSKRWVPLPPVAAAFSPSPPLNSLVSRVDRVVRLVVLNTAHSCLYYSYARCRVLRRFGYPVQFNVGLHNLHGRDVEGHCWLSLNEQVLFEEKDPNEMFPEKIGERNDVVYWAGLRQAEDRQAVRLKKF